ncbi:MAG: hypothetical protein GEU74_04865 [Nitriliruptorales bacterium]|nr:hypothetical protein [Nitriliruptorales bacterium]
MTTAQLERDLRALAEVIDWPETADLVPGVAGDLVRRPAAAGRATTPWLPRLRPVLVASVVTIALAATVLVVSPGARSAVASWFGIGGVQVERQEEAPTPAASGRAVPPPAATLENGLGVPVTLAQAREFVDFDVRVLDLRADLNRTGGGVYFDQSVEGGMVHIVYHVQAGLPSTDSKGVGALLTQFQGGDEPTFTKEVVRGQDVQFLEFDGGVAMWVTGRSHLLLRNAAGEPLRHTARLSANALVWVDRRGVTYRLETALDPDAAMELAETLK